MKKILLVCLIIILLLIGCGNQNSKEVNGDILEEHRQFLSTYGWHINTNHSEETEILNYYPERIESLKIAGLDLEQYKGKETKTTSYILEEKQINGDKMFAVIYEIDGEIIGGHGSLENWSPGLFSLYDKKRLVEDEIISK